MGEDEWTEELRKKAPNVVESFDRARNGPRKEDERPDVQLEFDPPEPVPGGMSPKKPALVSPQLRERIERKEELKKTLKRSFNDAARDAIER